MFWDGTSWIDESAEAKEPPPKPSMSAGRRRFRDWAATGVMGLALVGLIIPVFGIASASQVPFVCFDQIGKRPLFPLIMELH